jgi:hypothetical protein
MVELARRVSKVVKSEVTVVSMAGACDDEDIVWLLVDDVVVVSFEGDTIRVWDHTNAQSQGFTKLVRTSQGDIIHLDR